MLIRRGFKDMSKNRIPPDLQAWIDARKRYRISHAAVQMARELGMNPKKLGGLANERQEPWKGPLPEFIASIYLLSEVWKGTTRARRDHRGGCAASTGEEEQKTCEESCSSGWDGDRR